MRLKRDGVDRKSVSLSCEPVPSVVNGKPSVLSSGARAACAGGVGRTRRLVPHDTDAGERRTRVSAKVGDGYSLADRGDSAGGPPDWVGFENRYASRAPEAAHTLVLHGGSVAFASDTTNIELSEADLGIAPDQGRRLCSTYYANRLQGAKTDPWVALAVYVELADEGTQDKAYEAIKSAVGKPEAARAAHGYNHPGGPMDCLTAMLKAGVVSRSADGIHMRSPIPTMTDYLAQATLQIGGDHGS